MYIKLQLGSSIPAESPQKLSIISTESHQNPSRVHGTRDAWEGLRGEMERRREAEPKIKDKGQ